VAGHSKAALKARTRKLESALALLLSAAALILDANAFGSFAKDISKIVDDLQEEIKFMNRVC